MGIHGDTGGYRELQGVTRGYKGVTRGYRGLQGDTGGTRGYRGLQGITGGYKGLQKPFFFLAKTPLDTFSWFILHKNQS